MDADGQHNPEDIPRLVGAILVSEADLAIGARSELSFSEKVITKLTSLRVNTRDACSGFKALKYDLARRMKVRGKCTCGTFILEAKKLGAKVLDVKIKAKKRTCGESKMKRHHFIQFFIVLKELFF
jgi:glycosyltransferase involved in cell wall biosynthesis